MNAKVLIPAILALALQACVINPRSPSQERIELIGGHTYAIAHRGGPGPDGTRASVGRSLSSGVSFIELDVRLTKDGEAVILHDPTVDRTTDGTGAVADMTLAQIRRLDAGAKYRDPAHPARSWAGERVPTVQEMIRFVRNRGVILLELKVPEAANAVVAAVRRERAFSRVVVRSADRAVLRRLKELDPQVQTGTMGKVPVENLDAFADELRDLGVVSFTVTAIDRTQVAAFRARGIAVWGSNTNDPAAMRKFIDVQVDGIITDSCPLLADLLKNQEPHRPPEPDEDEPIMVAGLAAVRTGAWALPEFKATTPAGLRRINQAALFDVGMDFSLDVAPFFVQTSFDYAFSSELSIVSFSGQAGIEADLGKMVLPLSLRASVGVMFAQLEVDDSRFGDFDHGIGFLARAELLGRVSRSVVTSLWVDFRQIEFDYKPAVLSGDDHAGCATFAVGLSIGLRF